MAHLDVHVSEIGQLFECTCMHFQNELLPASERIPPHTRTCKKPTAVFDRSHLLQHLKAQAAESKIGKDYVLFVKKTPSAQVWYA